MKTYLLLALFALSTASAYSNTTSDRSSAGDSLPHVAYTFSRYRSPTSAELIAGIRPSGMEIRVWFRCVVWNANASYVTLQTTPQTYPPDTGLVEIAQTIEGFPADSARYYNYWVVVASSLDTIVTGRRQSSNTQFPLPGAKIMTLDADSLRPGSAELRALANSHGVPTQYFFSWGTSPSWANGGTVQVAADSSENDTIVSLRVTSLTPATPFYYSLHSQYPTDRMISNSGEFQRLDTPGDSNSVGLSVPLMIFSHLGPGGPYINFGVHSYASHCIDVGLGEYELPPPPPAPVMDARFRDPHRGNCFGLGTYLDLRTYSSPAQADTYKVGFAIDPSLYPITLRWPNLEGAFAGAVRFLMFGDTVDMKESTSCVIEDLEHTIGTIITEGPRPRPHLPLVIMKRPESVTASSVRVAATLIPNGLPTRAWFEWGPTEAYGNATPEETIGPSSGVVDIKAQLTLPTGTYHYRVVTQNSYGTMPGSDAVVVATTASPQGGSDRSPSSFTLEPNNPNPFNATTHLRFTLSSPGHVVLRIFSALGQYLETLVDGVKDVGSYDLVWDARNRPSGTYFYRLTVGGGVVTRGMVLLR